MKKFFFRTILILWILLQIALGAEIVIRLIPPEVPKDTMATLPWKFYPGYQTYAGNTNFTITNEKGVKIPIRTDAIGLRANEKVPISENGTVLVLGDSFVEAANTRAEEAFCSKLQTMLPGGTMTCVNGGISGASNYQAYLLMKNVFDHYKPCLVILMVYLGNDLRDNYWAPFDDEPPTDSASYLDSHAGFLKRLAARSRILSFIQSWGRQWRPEPHPFQDYFKSEIYTYETQPNAWVLEALRKTRRILKMMSEFCAERHVEFVVFGIPSKGQVEREFRQIPSLEAFPDNTSFALRIMKDPEAYSFDRPSEYYEAICHEIGIPYHTLLTYFRENRTQKLYGDLDVHWNATGQALGASFVAKKLIQDGVFSSKASMPHLKKSNESRARQP